ncbi:MAG: Hsp33 family molecular chaperone HslO [Bdellovibrionales bacterium]|nr:Hsp33 family molecular chaperone HslO [Bdellovibrionales bacterium]
MEYALRTESYYLRQKQVLLVQADLADFLVEYYLTLKEYGVTMEPAHNEQLKQLLGALAVHLTSRPPDESVAWTLLMHAEKPYSLFVTGSVAEAALVGQALYQDIRHSDVNVFNQQTSRPGHPTHKSAVRCESSEIKEMVESYYAQSEQLPLKITFHPDSDLVSALVAMPDYDAEWFLQNEPRSVGERLSDFDVRHLKSCAFRFACSCSLEKLLPFFQAIPAEQLAELYGRDEVLLVNCPRCGRTFEVERSRLENK